jgi:hypothetical protein
MMRACVPCCRGPHRRSYRIDQLRQEDPPHCLLLPQGRRLLHASPSSELPATTPPRPPARRAIPPMPSPPHVLDVRPVDAPRSRPTGAATPVAGGFVSSCTAVNIWGERERAPFVGGDPEQSQNECYLWITGWRPFLIFTPYFEFGSSNRSPLEIA